MTDYKAIESLLCSLLDTASSIFSSAECEEVQKFIDVGEYGIALETAVAIYSEKKVQLTPNVVAMVEKIATEMKMNSVGLIQALRGPTTGNDI